MRHTARDPKTGKFISTRRHIKIVAGPGWWKQFHQLMLDELNKWEVRLFKKKKKEEPCVYTGGIAFGTLGIDHSRPPIPCKYEVEPLHIEVSTEKEKARGTP